MKMLFKQKLIPDIRCSILTSGRHGQTLTVPVGPRHLNSRTTVDPRGNSLCIYL